MSTYKRDFLRFFTHSLPSRLWKCFFSRLVAGNWFFKISFLIVSWHNASFIFRRCERTEIQAKPSSFKTKVSSGACFQMHVKCFKSMLHVMASDFQTKYHYKQKYGHQWINRKIWFAHHRLYTWMCLWNFSFKVPNAWKRRRLLYIQISVDSLCFCSTLTSEIEKSAVIFTPDERLSFRNCFGFCRICSLVDWKIIDCVVHLIQFLKCYLIVESVTSHTIQRVEFLFNPNSKALFLPSLLFCEILNFTSILKKSPKTIK